MHLISISKIQLLALTRAESYANAYQVHLFIWHLRVNPDLYFLPSISNGSTVKLPSSRKKNIQNPSSLDFQNFLDFRTGQNSSGRVLGLCFTKEVPLSSEIRISQELSVD